MDWFDRLAAQWAAMGGHWWLVVAVVSCGLMLWSVFRVSEDEELAAARLMWGDPDALVRRQEEARRRLPGERIRFWGWLLVLAAALTWRCPILFPLPVWLAYRLVRQVRAQG